MSLAFMLIACVLSSVVDLIRLDFFLSNCVHTKLNIFLTKLKNNSYRRLKGKNCLTRLENQNVNFSNEQRSNLVIFQKGGVTAPFSKPLKTIFIKSLYYESFVLCVS